MFEAIISVIFSFIKVMVLLFVISGGMGIFRTYLPEQKIKELLVLKRGIKGHFIASILGAVTPFQSKSFNLFAVFLESGVPSGIAFSFLLTSSIINEYIIILMLVFFGWEITLIYILSGLFMGIFVGWILSKIDVEKYILHKIKRREVLIERGVNTRNRLKKGIYEGLLAIKKIWFLVLLGMTLQFFIFIYLPEESIDNFVNYLGIFGIPLAIAIGVPLPGKGFAVIPIALALFEKGIPLGIAFAFLISLVSLSISEAREMEKYMGRRLIFIFFSLVIIIIAIISYFLNFLFY